MDNKELKAKINSKELSDEGIVLKYSDNDFICNQYIKEIASYKNKEIVYIENTNDVQENIFGDDNYLYVLKTDKFNEPIDSLKNNIIIVCKELGDACRLDYIDMVKIENWQILDYAKYKLPGLSEEEIRWLCDICKYDIYRLDNECSKMSIFNKLEQEQVFESINADDGYVDLNPLTIFNFINYLIKKDIKGIISILKDLKNIDVEGTGCVTILRKQFLNIINIQLNPKATAESLNMSLKQFNAVRYNCGKFSNSKLIDIYDFLTSIDYRIKSGELQFCNDNRLNNAKLVDYITCNILSV